MEFESIGHSLGCRSRGGGKGALQGLEAGANKTYSPSSASSCLFPGKIRQECGEKKANRAAGAVGRVKVLSEHEEELLPSEGDGALA